MNEQQLLDTFVDKYFFKHVYIERNCALEEKIENLLKDALLFAYDKGYDTGYEDGQEYILKDL